MISALMLGAAIVSGTVATYFYDEEAGFPTRLASGAVIGLTLLALARVPVRQALRADLAAAKKIVVRPPLVPLVYGGLMALLLGCFFARDVYTKPDGWYTGVLNNLGDLPFHIGIVSGFAYGDNYPPQHPEMAGVKLTYHFLADFLAAMMLRGGMSISTAFFVENMVFALALTALLWRWGWALTRDRIAAYLMPVLVFFSGGLGWWLLLNDARQTDRGLFSLIAQPPHDYTIQVPQDPGLRWGNALTTLLLPQRSLLMGLPLLLIVCTLWWQAFNGEEGGDAPRRRMLAAGALTGLLPLVHAQNFVALVGVGACLALITQQWRLWLPSLALAIALAVPQLLWLLRGSATQGAGLLTWHWGWDKGDANFLWFWFKNTGLLIPLLIAAWTWPGLIPLSLRRFYLPFILCFLIPNVLQLEPWVWDTMKILFLWFVASVPLVARLLAQIWRDPPFHVSLTVSRTAAAVALVTMTLAGSLDVWRVASGMTVYQEFDTNGLALAGLIERATPPTARVLGAPTYNHPLMLTGRRSMMGYGGHLWSQGIDDTARAAAVQDIYAGKPDAQALLDQYHVQYVVVGPLERSLLPVNVGFFSHFPLAGDAGGYALYKNPQLP